MNLSQRFETLRKRLTVGPAYGVMILLFLAVFFWGVFKIITPENFGSTSALVNYFLSSIIYSVGGCGLFFIVVMGMFDFSIGANLFYPRSSALSTSMFTTAGEAFFTMGTTGDMDAASDAA